MKVISEVKTTWIDPLTFRELKINEKVTLKSDSGIVSDFLVHDIYDDNSILLKKPEVKLLSSLKSNTLFLNASTLLSAKSLRQNDVVQIKLKNGKTIPFRVDLIINNDFLILGPENKKELSFVDKLKIFWK